MAVTEVKMKILIDNHSKRVLFAEVGKEGVDFLFYILLLPIATVIRLINKMDMVGCIANLYDSIENLNQTYLQPNQTKEMLLIPKLPVSPGSIPLLSLPNAPATQKSFYRCPNNSHDPFSDFSYKCFYNVTDSPNAHCPKCQKLMTAKMNYVFPLEAKAVSLSAEGGIVKGVVTYMVMDNLEVKPMSTISSITLLNQFSVKDVCALQEKTVTLTVDKALKLLKLSLKSITVLTYVFLP